MKIVFSGIEKGDALYVVYVDKNGEYSIGQATVTGFTHWTYPIGDRWETWGEKPMTNIDYTFNGIKFSRNLEYVMDSTHFTDSPTIGENYSSVMEDKFVETFTTPDEAKEYVLARLNEYIFKKKEQKRNTLTGCWRQRNINDKTGYSEDTQTISPHATGNTYRLVYSGTL